MNNPHKAFLETCSAAIGATALTPRERLVFLVISWLGEDATRKDIIEFTGISNTHLSTLIGNLKSKHLLLNNLVVNSSQNGNTEVPKKGINSQNGNTEVSKMETNSQNGNDSASESGASVSLPPRSPSSSSPDPSNNNPPISPLSFTSDACSREESFDEFWSFYPKKREKDKAHRAFMRCLEQGVDAGDIIEGIRRMVKLWEDAEKASCYIPYPATWLNRKQWELDLPLDFGAERKLALKQTYSEDENRFLQVYGKKPYGKDEAEFFHDCFQRALEEIGDVNVLIETARLYVETMLADEGSLRFQKRPHRWLDDCAYKPFLDRARRSVGTRQNVNCMYTPPEGFLI